MRAFLSSTYGDLIEHRRAVTNALERLGQQVGRMEVFGAVPAEPLEVCLREIDACSVFIGVYAYRYGYVPPDSEWSITESEFRRARDQKKPIFCYFVDDTYIWPPDLIEGVPGSMKLTAFKNVVRDNLVVDTFREPLDLAVRVTSAVGSYLLRNQELLRISPSSAQEVQHREALISLLEDRKEGILNVLSDNSATRDQFVFLHRLNIDAIRKGELLISHLLTSNIHHLLGLGHNPLTVDYTVLATSKTEPKAPVQEKPPIPEYPYFYNPKDRIFSEVEPEFVELRPESHAVDLALLLNSWLESVINPLENMLAKQRTVAELERDAESRNVLIARRRPNGYVTCPHCDVGFKTGATTGQRVKCPGCYTRIDLVTELAPTEYEGHQMLDRVCTKCGLSMRTLQSREVKRCSRSI